MKGRSATQRSVQVARRSTRPDMKTAFHARSYGRFIEIKSNLRKKNFIERIKAPIFLEAVVAIEIMEDVQSNLDEKDNPSILKDEFSSRTDLSIFTSITPVLLDWSK